ncbi:MAG: hypothetical protein KDE06_10655, partial [Rhodobacteraceae bacterium]|nr:hypothetical protein [Paracoccaceae bacterium]
MRAFRFLFNRRPAVSAKDHGGQVPTGKVTERIGSSAALIVGNLFGGQMLRLAGNLILSRIL